MDGLASIETKPNPCCTDTIPSLSVIATLVQPHKINCVAASRMNVFTFNVNQMLLHLKAKVFWRASFVMRLIFPFCSNPEDDACEH